MYSSSYNVGSFSEFQNWQDFEKRKQSFFKLETMDKIYQIKFSPLGMLSFHLSHNIWTVSDQYNPLKIQSVEVNLSKVWSSVNLKERYKHSWWIYTTYFRGSSNKSTRIYILRKCKSWISNILNYLAKRIILELLQCINFQYQKFLKIFSCLISHHLLIAKPWCVCLESNLDTKQNI